MRRKYGLLVVRVTTSDRCVDCVDLAVDNPRVRRGAKRRRDSDRCKTKPLVMTHDTHRSAFSARIPIENITHAEAGFKRKLKFFRPFAAFLLQYSGSSICSTTRPVVFLFPKQLGGTAPVGCRVTITFPTADSRATSGPAQVTPATHRMLLSRSTGSAEKPRPRTRRRRH